MKNKVLSLFLVLSLVMSFLTFPVIANATDYSCIQSIQEYEISGSTIFVTAKITNNGSSRAYVNGYAAVYNSAGELKGVNSCSVSVSTSKSTTVVYEISNYAYASGDYVKAFLWDDNFSPTADCVTEPVINGEEIEGIILETYLSNPDYEEGNNTVIIFITKSTSASYKAGSAYSFVANNTNAAAYLGYTVIAHVGKDADGNDAVFDVSEKSGANTLITIDTDLINEFDDYSITYYESETAKHTTEAEIHTSVSANNTAYETTEQFIVVNGFNLNYFGYEIFDIWYELDEITLLDNDNDGHFEFIFATVPTVDAVEFVAETVELEEEGYYIAGEESDIYLEHTNPDMYIHVIKDGIVSTVDSILPGDTITCLDASVNVLMVYVSSKVVTGTVEEVDDYIHYIDGSPYTLSPITFGYDESLRPGDEGVFHINAFGEIAYVTAPTPDFEYFYLTDTDMSEGDFGDEQYLVKGVTQSGSEKVFAIKSKKVDVYPEEDYVEENLDAEEVYYFIEGYVGLIGITLSNEGEISAIYFPDSVDTFASIDRYENDAEEQAKTYHATRGTYGAVEVTADTLIFNVNTSDETVRTSTVGELFVHGSSYSFIAYGEYEGVSDALVTFDIEMPDDEVENIEPVISEPMYAFILASDVSEGTFGDDAFLVLAVTPDGATKAYTIKSKKVDVYTEDGAEELLTAEEAFEIICDYYGIAKITLTEDGYIADFYLEGSEGFSYDTTYENDAEDKASSYNKTSGTYGTVSLKPDTVIFNINAYDEEVYASTVANAFVNGSSYSFVSYGQNTAAPDVIVTYDVEIPEIEEAEPVIGESEYVFIIDSDYAEGNFGEESFLIQVVTAEGEIKTLPIKSKKVDIYTEDGIEEALIDHEAFDFIYDYCDIAKIAITEDGYIADFYLAGCEYLPFNDRYIDDADNEYEEYNAETLTYGTVSIDSETVLYNIDGTEESLEDGVSVGKAVDIMQHGASYSFIAYGKEGEAADVILTFDLRAYFNSESPVMVVTKVSDVIAQNEETIKITGVVAGETISVVVHPDEGWMTGVEVGNVIMYTISDGCATDVQILFDSDAEAPGELFEGEDITTDFSDEYVSVHYGEITNKTTKNVTLDDESKFYFAENTNVTVVDYTGARVSVTAGSLSDVKASSIYTRTAFVKTLAEIEDEVSDIVVFIEN